MKYFLLALKNWNKFSGRSNRPEFWYFVFYYTIFYIILGIIDSIFLGWQPSDPSSIGILGTIFNLIVLIPSLSITARRLHDINKSGWNLLWMLIPIFGALYIIILNILKSTDGDNKYGSPSTL